MNVFITGGTGFVGNEVVRQLLIAGHSVHCLVRPGSEGKLRHKKDVILHSGDTGDVDSLKMGMQGCEAVIHLVGIIREFPGKGITFDLLHTEATKNALEAATTCGARRFLQMSANGTRANAKTGYHRTKWQAEEAVRASKLDWTIFPEIKPKRPESKAYRLYVANWGEPHTPPSHRALIDGRP